MNMECSNKAAIAGFTARARGPRACWGSDRNTWINGMMDDRAVARYFIGWIDVERKALLR